jgi:hypothetical protein
VHLSVHLLGVLRHQRGDVGPAAALEVRHRGHDRAREVQERMRAEIPAAEVLQPLDLALVVPVLPHDQVHAAVAGQVGAAHVGHPGDVLGDHVVAEPPPAQVLHHHDLPDAVVVGKYLAHARHKKVRQAVAVDVADRDVDRSLDRVPDELLGEDAPGALAYPAYAVGRRVAHEDSGEAGPFQVDDGHVCDHGVAPYGEANGLRHVHERGLCLSRYARARARRPWRLPHEQHQQVNDQPGHDGGEQRERPRY